MTVLSLAVTSIIQPNPCPLLYMNSQSLMPTHLQLRAHQLGPSIGAERLGTFNWCTDGTVDD